MHATLTLYNIEMCSMEMLDKADAPPIQESYPLAVAYTALLDAVKSITTAVEDLPLPPANVHCETVAPGMFVFIICVHTHTHTCTHAHMFCFKI